jgi:SAM-dependent methyltransferase
MATEVNLNEFWYHCIEVQSGVITPGLGHTNLAPARLAMAGVDFTDCRCLDIACWDGLLSVLMARRGAVEVTAWDREHRPHCELWPTVNHVWGQWCGGVYDVVTCTGLLYHTLDPLAWLLRARAAVRNGGLLVLETAAYIDMQRKDLVWNGGRYYPTVDEQNYWFPTIGLLRQWLPFARLQPIRVEWFPQGEVCRIAILCRAVERLDGLDPWQEWHQALGNSRKNSLTLGEFIDWEAVRSEKPPVFVFDDRKEDIGKLPTPINAETQKRLAVLMMEDMQ